jgi:type IV pilus assembly protein PilN
MMRINLLPIKEIQAAITRRREIIVGSGALGSILFLFIAVYFYQSYQLTQTQNELTTLRSEIQALNARVKEVGDLQNRIKEFNSKHKVIAELHRRKTGPVGVMESLANAVPARLWLTEFKEVGGKLNMIGFAADNQTVADFLTALTATPYFRDVELVETAQGTQETGTYKRFSIRSTVFYVPNEAAAAISPDGAVPKDKKS